MRERHLLLVVLFLALAVRLAGMEHGLVVFAADDPPPGVKGTVYTFYPDEREFMACFRSLGNSLAEFRAGEAPGGMRLDAATITSVVRAVFSGRITFAPAWPLASLPVAPYIIFFFTLPVVLCKWLVGLYPGGVDSNAVFADAVRTGRFLSAVAGAGLVLIVRALTLQLCRSRVAAWTATLVAAFHPLGIMLGHYASYNVFVACLELGALLGFARWHAADDRRGLVAGGFLAGLALATKTTAAPLLPLLVLAAALRTESAPVDRIRSAAGGLAAAAGAWLVALSYSLLTQPADILKTIRTQLMNASGEIAGLPTPKALIAANYFQGVLPFSLSTAIAWLAYLAVVPVIFLALRERREPRRRALVPVLVYLAIWLALSATNGINQPSRMMVPVLLFVVVLAVAVDWLVQLGKRGRGIVLALLAVSGFYLAGEAFLVTRWFLTEDVRLQADRWIADRIPAGARIGFFYEMMYNYQPTSLYTDYFWRRERRYRYHADLDLSSDSMPVDFLVTNRMELLTDDRVLVPDADRIIASHGLTRLATFAPDLAWGPFRVAPECTEFFLPNLFVSEIAIYGRDRAGEGREPLIETPASRP